MNLEDGLLEMMQSIQQVGLTANQRGQQQFAREILTLIQADVTQRVEFHQIIHDVVKKCEEPFHG